MSSPPYDVNNREILVTKEPPNVGLEPMTPRLTPTELTRFWETNILFFILTYVGCSEKGHFVNQLSFYKYLMIHTYVHFYSAFD